MTQSKPELGSMTPSQYTLESTTDCRREVLEAVASEWNKQGIKYCVLHGLDEYPAKMGRDLDVLLATQHEARAFEIAGAVFAARGWSVLAPPRTWGRRLIACKAGDWSSIVEVHALDGLFWHNVTITREPQPSTTLGPFQLDPWCAFVKRILLPLLSGDGDRFQEKSHELQLSPAETQAVAQNLPQLCGAAVAQELSAALFARDLAKIKAGLPTWQRAIMRRGLIHAPLSSAIGVLKRGYRRLILPFSPCGPIVALVGPDGVGKSSVLAELQRQKSIFTRITIRHWRPGLLPLLGKITRRDSTGGAANPTGAPRRKAGRFASLRQLYYAMDFWLGHYLRDRVDSAKQHLVLYDRCALDMTVDPVRYGLSSGKLMARWYRILPKPDLIILLHDTPERIHQRKPELEIPEIARQLASWREHMNHGRVQQEIQIDGPPEVIAERIRKTILQHWFQTPKR